MFPWFFDACTLWSCICVTCSEIEAQEADAVCSRDTSYQSGLLANWRPDYDRLLTELSATWYVILLSTVDLIFVPHLRIRQIDIRSMPIAVLNDPCLK